MRPVGLFLRLPPDVRQLASLARSLLSVRRGSGGERPATNTPIGGEDEIRLASGGLAARLIEWRFFADRSFATLAEAD